MSSERTIIVGKGREEAIADLIITGKPEPTREQIKPVKTENPQLKGGS